MSVNKTLYYQLKDDRHEFLIVDTNIAQTTAFLWENPESFPRFVEWINRYK